MGEENRSLIRPDRTNYQQLKCYENQTNAAGMHKLHGLRHAYAQQRYHELTGWEYSALGGPRRQDLNDDAKAQDRVARQIISEELGHNRVEVVSVYCGS